MTVAIRCALEVCNKPGFVKWAQAWLSGADRSAARAAAYAADAAAYAAARAAYAAAAYAADAAAVAAARAAAFAAYAAAFAAARAAVADKSLPLTAIAVRVASDLKIKWQA